MNYNDRIAMVNYLKHTLPYKDDWYQTLSDRQVMAIWYKTKANPPKPKVLSKNVQLSFFGSGGGLK